MRPGTIPGSFHLRLILSPVAAHGLRGVGVSLLIALSQVATGAGVVAQLIRPKRTQRPSVELAPAQEPT
jgi:hypothetical protein